MPTKNPIYPKFRYISNNLLNVAADSSNGTKFKISKDNNDLLLSLVASSPNDRIPLDTMLL